MVVNLLGLDASNASNAGTLTATTAADGGYLFTNLIAGRYQVRVQTPAGFVTSTGTNGSLTGPYEPAPATAGNNQDHGTASGGVVNGPVVNLQARHRPARRGGQRPDPERPVGGRRQRPDAGLRLLPPAVGRQPRVAGQLGQRPV